MASNKNKLAFLSMPAPASYVSGLGRGCILFSLLPISFSHLLPVVHLASQRVLILVLLEKAHLRKSLRKSSLSFVL